MNPKNLSNLMAVAEMRHMQTLHEVEELKGPDDFVKHFLTWRSRLRIALLWKSKIDTYRCDPFYYYLIARTHYYDKIYRDAIDDGFQYIVNIGCGRDTRSYRFGRSSEEYGPKILECDQAAAIADRQLAAKRLKASSDIHYAALDLNAASQPQLKRWLEQTKGEKVLVMMEGVSTYIDEDAFGRFLDMLAVKLPQCSRLVYDIKLRGVADQFGLDNRESVLFRLSAEESELVAYHEKHGFRLDYVELSIDLTKRLLPSLTKKEINWFTKDCLLQMDISG